MVRVSYSIMARYKINPAKQSFFCYSLGGLMVLRALFRNPAAFSLHYDQPFDLVE
jgi:predicted alpha/beta superfamily hydrolase